MKDFRYMRSLLVFLLLLCSARTVFTQATGTKLPDSIDTSRTIIAKLDRATQNDPPPNFASSILVRTHQEAMTFVTLADAASTRLRGGGEYDGSTMFSLYSEFIDLFDMYGLFTSVEKRPLELDKVQSVAMSKEYADAKTTLEIATYARLLEMEEKLKSCQPPTRK